MWWPLKGLLAVVDQVHRRAGGGSDEEAGLRRRLMELRLRFELDEIDEAAYDRGAAEVTRRLQELHEQGVEETGLREDPPP